MNNIVSRHTVSKIQQICCWDSGVLGLKMANFGAGMPSWHQNKNKLVLGCHPSTTLMSNVASFTAGTVSLY